MRRRDRKKRHKDRQQLKQKREHIQTHKKHGSMKKKQKQKLKLRQTEKPKQNENRDKNREKRIDSVNRQVFFLVCHFRRRDENELKHFKLKKSFIFSFDQMHII